MRDINKDLVAFKESATNYEVKVSVRRNPHKIQIKNSSDVHDVARILFKENEIEFNEKVYALFLDAKNQIIAYRLLSTGSLTKAIIDPIILGGIALRLFASSVILMHNHPTGNTNPSQDDIGITKKIEKILKIHSITLLDHLIVTKENVFSFADERMINNNMRMEASFME